MKTLFSTNEAKNGILWFKSLQGSDLIIVLLAASII